MHRFRQVPTFSNMRDVATLDIRKSAVKGKKVLMKEPVGGTKLRYAKTIHDEDGSSRSRTSHPFPDDTLSTQILGNTFK